MSRLTVTIVLISTLVSGQYKMVFAFEKFLYYSVYTKKSSCKLRIRTLDQQVEGSKALTNRSDSKEEQCTQFHEQPCPKLTRLMLRDREGDSPDEAQ